MHMSEAYGTCHAEEASATHANLLQEITDGRGTDDQVELGMDLCIEFWERKSGGNVRSLRIDCRRRN